ncbi:MAG: AIPR family protein [Candidatus Methanoperedens sp.]|nr:AIPR family protein [Candidatus Methanoperedens sp.]MCZ7371907.1 AIPR family protein [Candidatus Methanoperedens sp.]
MPSGTRSTPTEVEMDFIEYKTYDVPGYPRMYTFFIKGSDYLDLPLDANVREPSEKSQPYKDMIKTLKTAPIDFLLQNGGIDVISTKVTVTVNKKNKTVKINFPPGTGIVNGGHTQLALLDTKKEQDISKAVVRLDVIEQEFSPEKLAMIAASRNTASNVKSYSVAEKRGYFAKIKLSMNADFEKHIIWFENRKVPNDRGLTAVDLIARLNLFNIKSYQSNWHDGTEQPNKSATSKNATFNYWLGHQNEFLHTYPLVNDIINLEEHILTTFHDSAPRGFTNLGVITSRKDNPRKTIFLGKDIIWDLPIQFLLPLLSSFRGVVKYDEASERIGWYEKPEKIFNRIGNQLLQEITRTYKNHHNQINQMSKDPNLWRILFDTVDRNIAPKTSEWIMYGIPK